MDFVKPLSGFEPACSMCQQSTVLTIKLQDLQTYVELSVRYMLYVTVTVESKMNMLRIDLFKNA